jgi:hypothetical protein
VVKCDKARFIDPDTLLSEGLYYYDIYSGLCLDGAFSPNEAISLQQILILINVLKYIYLRSQDSQPRWFDNRGNKAPNRRSRSKDDKEVQSSAEFCIIANPFFRTRESMRGGEPCNMTHSR